MSYDPASIASLVVFSVGSFIAAIAVTGAWAVQSYFMRCKASKWLDYASHNGLTLAAIFKSNHVTKFVPCKVHANGYLETLSRDKKDPKHYIPILRTAFTRSVSEVSSVLSDMPDNEKDDLKQEAAAQVKEAAEIATMEKEILPPSYLEGSNCPIYFVYDGVAVAVTAEALLALGIPSRDFKLKMPGGKAYIDFNLPLNPQLPKKYLTKLYDQSTVDGYGQDRWQAGWLARGKSMDNNVKMLFLAGFGLCIVGCALMVAAFFL